MFHIQDKVSIYLSNECNAFPYNSNLDVTSVTLRACPFLTALDFCLHMEHKQRSPRSEEGR